MGNTNMKEVNSDYSVTKSFFDGRNILHIDMDVAQQVWRKFKDNVLKGTPRGGFTLMLDNPQWKQDAGGLDAVDFYFRPDDDKPGWFVTDLQHSGIFGNVEDVLSDAFREKHIQVSRLASYEGNPDGDPIYPNEIEHGYGEPLAGGTDVMRRLQNQLLHEQGTDDLMRPESPRLAQRVAARFANRPSMQRVADAWWGAPPPEPTPYEAFISYMDANAVRFPKGMAGWWLPAHNMGFKMIHSGKVIVSRYQILPTISGATVYMPGDSKIVISPMWWRSEKWPSVYEPSINLAQKFLALAIHEPTIPNTVKEELHGLENKFGISIPPEMVTRLSMNATRNAISRWGAPRIRNTAIPI
jgi:hypothetical protein